MDKVFVGIFYETVVVTRAKKRADATVALRKELGARHWEEAQNISLMNHVAFVYWSEKRKSYWYRLPSSDDPCSIHSDRVPAELRALVPKKELDRPGWVTSTSAGKAP